MICDVDFLPVVVWNWIKHNNYLYSSQIKAQNDFIAYHTLHRNLVQPEAELASMTTGLVEEHHKKTRHTMGR